MNIVDFARMPMGVPHGLFSAAFASLRSNSLTSALGLSCLCLLAGCGGGGKPTDAAAPRGHQKQPEPALALRYELARKIEIGLKDLHGIAMGPGDKLHAAGEEGIRVFDPAGKPVKEWKTSAPARCVAVTPDGTAYVGLATKVEVYDPEGKLLRGWGQEGQEPGQFRVVTAIAVSGQDVFVADAGNRCIHRFGANGEYRNDIARENKKAGVQGLIVPSPYLDCAVDEQGRLVVSNPGRHRVERYGFDGKLLSSWGESGFEYERFCGCCNPTNLAPMPGGRTVTSEKGIERVKVYDADGKMLAYIPPDPIAEGAAGIDLAVDSKGDLYVMDPKAGKVLVFGAK